ncbi:T9SS type A sorting domain-containing protein [Epilithonimonas sp.]|uniref:T9SS type A sorting domain-containing protein n=1 Tax=Epilithonimonas sp. TaxID=2894511 RepID=UPI002897AFB3|nr:T9SS type A sorting domain-containing protein [Epilithonimonas sp.]
MKQPNIFRRLYSLIFLLFLSGICYCQNPYKAPLYWNPYEYHITREMAGVQDNYLTEQALSDNINWLEQNLKSYGYNMVCMDGWGDTSQINENGYRKSHSSHWQHDYAWWSQYLQGKGMTFGMYENPLWLHVDANDTTKKIVGTNINVSSLLDPNENAMWFRWVQVDRPGAEEYVKGYVKYYADMGIKYLRVDFLSWFETGYDRNLGTVGPQRTRAQYEKALKWMREACDANGVYLSLVMPNLTNVAELEKVYGHLFRINSDALEGTWNRFSDVNRGIHFPTWSQYDSAFDGFIYWSQVTGNNKVQLDGDFIRINTFANDTEKRSVISLNILAGGPVTIADQFDTIGNDLWLYQNSELLDLNTVKFIGKPLSNDPNNVGSQTWRGQLSNGDWIIGFFNREKTPQVRSMNFLNQLGITGQIMVRDLWQHANLGKMNSISVNVPPHGCVILKLIKNSSETCNSQTITFPTIPNKNANDPVFSLSATSSAGQAITYEVNAGPAKIVNNQVQLTGYNGTVYLQAKQSGANGFCAAIPQLQSFNVTGGHNSQIYVGGTYNNWSMNSMTMENNVWKLKNQILLAGNHELKFANTSNFSGQDWGNANGLSGTAQQTTGGGVNIKFSIVNPGTYNIEFNDLTLQYNIQFAPTHQQNMYVGGTFNNWALQQMTLQNDIWTRSNVSFSAGDHELKFANTSNWTGDDWGNANGTTGFAQLTTGGAPNVKFNLASSGNYNILFNDMTLGYQVYNVLAVNDVSKKPLSIYPNPADKNIFITSDNEIIRSYEIYDMTGKLIKSQKTDCKQCEINVSKMIKGNYILNVNLENRIVGKKIIIK